MPFPRGIALKSATDIPTICPISSRFNTLLQEEGVHVTSKLLFHPELKLENVRDHISGISCDGRGRATASSRGYNVERLAGAVFGERKKFFISSNGCYDKFTYSGGNKEFQIECKSCVDRYPSGGYGRFRIWRHHHKQHCERWTDFDGVESLYFFLVYTVYNGVEKEVGKLVVSAAEIDDILDSWTDVDHPTMGEAEQRDLSWNMLLRKLGVSHEEFTTKDIVNLTEYGTVDSDS